MDILKAVYVHVFFFLPLFAGVGEPIFDANWRGIYLSFSQFYKSFCSNLDDIIWKPPTESSKSKITKSKSRRR